ncbi:MAG: fibronectin type III domain-containing protein, partial [Bacteroidota bacterium]
QGASAGWYTMNLNLNITSGITYRLTATFGSVVSRLISGANYASTAYNNLGTFGTITSGYDFGVSATTYNYFHNISATGAGCFGNRQAVHVTVNSPTPISAGTGTTICQGSNTILGASSTDPDYVYTWSPSTGLSTTSGAAPTASPTSSTLYTVRGTNPNTGCTASDTVRVRVSLAPTTPVVMPSSPAVCAGVSLPLEIQSASTITLGTATTSTSGSGVAPFSAFWEGEHKQYLITAAELNAMGYVGAGNIGAISFTTTVQGALTQTGGNPAVQTDFKISMGLTTASSMTGYATPIGGSLSLVYGPVNLAPPAVGVNKYTFASPFAWDGVSNIVVDVCHDNDMTASCTSCYSTAGTVAASTTSFTSVYGSYSDDIQACGVVSAFTTSGTTRPDMVFDFIGNAGVVWTSNSTPLNLYLDSAATNPYVGTVEAKVYVNAFATQTYTVTATNAANCTSSSNVTVTINTAPSAPANFAISNVTSTSFNLTWNATTNTSDYLVDVSDNAGFTTFVSGYNGLSVFTTNASVAGLTPGTIYYARVRARNSCFASSNSSASVLMKPSSPTSLFSSSVTSSGYTANWTGSFGATSYLLDVSANRAFTTFVSGYNGLSVSGSNQAVSGLSQGTKYFYRLRSVNATGNSAFSIIDSVTTGVNTVSISLTAFLQGMYVGSSVMTSAPFNADGVSPMTIADTITVELHDPTNTAITS